MGCGSSGAKDANSWKACVRAGGSRLPLLDSITYQGVFNEHTYNTGGPEPSRVLAVPAQGVFIPTKSQACCDGAPEGAVEELWVGCFLKSCRDGRPRDEVPIDLVVVLDISGSMHGGLGGDGGTRLDLAKQALRSLLPKLRPDDRFGLATFNTSGHLIQSLAAMPSIDLGALSARIDELTAAGGTTMAAGLQAAVETCKEAPALPGRRHRRLLFLTDMHDATPDGLSALISEQASKGLFVSFAGIGMEFNSTLAEVASKHPGANYFCITRAEEMQKVIVDDFDFNFFPAAFEVEVAAQSDCFELEAVFGTQFDTREEPLQAQWHPSTHRFYPLDFRKTVRSLLLCMNRLHRVPLPMPALRSILDCLGTEVSTVIRVDTVFPSAVSADGSVEGGLVLLKMRPKPGLAAGAGVVRLTTRYSVEGQEHVSSEALTLPSPPGPLDAAVRKGVLLQRYVEACRRFLRAAALHGPQRMPELAAAFAALTGLSEELRADAAATEAACPGVAQDLERFLEMARPHVEELQDTAAQPKKPDRA